MELSRLAVGCLSTTAPVLEGHLSAREPAAIPQRVQSIDLAVRGATDRHNQQQMQSQTLPSQEQVPGQHLPKPASMQATVLSEHPALAWAVGTDNTPPPTTMHASRAVLMRD
jgi:hypothetical protein